MMTSYSANPTPIGRPLQRSLALSSWICLVVGTAFGATLQVPRDYQSIQGAIDAAAPGDLVLVDPGTYTGRLRLSKGVTLKSVGDNTPGQLGLRRAEATIIDGGGEQGEGPGVEMAEGAVVDGFTVTNVGRYDEALWEKHHRTQGNQQSHEHIGKPGTPGIGARGVNCVIRNNIVHHIGYSGIAVQGAKGANCSPQIVKNFCYRNMGGGIGIMQKATPLVDSNTCFQNFYAGIGHDDSSPTVLRNTCYENVRAGIGISHGACPVVRNNHCYRNRRAGIGIRTGANTRPVVEDNQCYENDMAGIGTEAGAAPLIRGNHCHHNKLAGIGARTGAAPTIIGNECHHNQKAGIGQESDAATTLIANHCHHNQAAGIGFGACESGRSVVLDNRLIDNQLVAVGIHTGWHVRMSGNELSRKGGLPPIVMVFKGAVATLTSNTIRGGGVAGIRVAGTVVASDNRILGDAPRRRGPPNFGVWALPGASVHLTGNEIRAWRHALHATRARVTAIDNRVAEYFDEAWVIQDPSSPPTMSGNTESPAEESRND